MPIMFNTLLREAGFPAADVRLLRHKDKRAAKGRSPYEWWRDDRPKFDQYQSTQRIENREKFRARYWASFVVTTAKARDGSESELTRVPSRNRTYGR